MAVATIEGCDCAGIFLLDGDVVTNPDIGSPGAGGRFLPAVDREGPCLDAVTHRMVFYAEDLSDDSRWPTFSPLAVTAGIRSVLAVPLSADVQLGAVNLARLPIAFGVVIGPRPPSWPRWPAWPSRWRNLTEDEERRDHHFRTALASREIIGEALGILMERERISANQAFDVLRRASQHLNVKLREVAQNLVDTRREPRHWSCTAEVTLGLGEVRS